MATTSRVSQASAELACSPRRSGENLPKVTTTLAVMGLMAWVSVDIPWDGPVQRATGDGAGTATKDVGLSPDSDAIV